jgi:hypothetical protein
MASIRIIPIASWTCCAEDKNTAHALLQANFTTRPVKAGVNAAKNSPRLAVQVDAIVGVGHGCIRQPPQFTRSAPSHQDSYTNTARHIDH